MKNYNLYRFEVTPKDTRLTEYRARSVGGVTGKNYLRLKRHIRDWLADHAKGTKIMEGADWAIIDFYDERAALHFKMRWG